MTTTEEKERRRQLASSIKLTLLPGNADALRSLARENANAMPEPIRGDGVRAIERVAGAVLSLFPYNGVGVPLDGPEVDDLFDLLNIRELKAELNLSEFDDVHAFVREIAQYARMNPILLAFGAEWLALPKTERYATFPTGAGRDAEVRTAVFYCFLLHALCKAIVSEPKSECTTLLDRLVNIFNTVRKQTDYKRHLSFFGRVKIALIDLYINMMAKRKHNLEPIDEKAGLNWRLPVNILAAMLEDLRRGCDGNAHSAFELMIEPNDQAVILGAGNAIDREWRDLGVGIVTPPLPHVWANLYVSWNLAFVSTYECNPMFYAKLLAPIVLGLYHSEDPGLFLYPRVLCLYVHLQWYAVSMRASEKSKTTSTAV